MERFKPWKDRWYHNIPLLIEKTMGYYEAGGKNPFKVTAKQVIEKRQWAFVDRDLLVDELEELNWLYIPQALEPGPMILFPQLDLTGNYLRAQTKPFYELRPNSKYVTLGVGQESFLGPVWLGNQDGMRKEIIEKGYVVICEGAFDLLAMRCAAPECPTLCSLTKEVSEAHVDYLRLHGVDRIYFLYDNDKDNAGQKSMDALVKEFSERNLKIETLACPLGDPSECLQSRTKTRVLRKILLDLN